MFWNISSFACLIISIQISKLLCSQITLYRSDNGKKNPSKTFKITFFSFFFFFRLVLLAQIIWVCKVHSKSEFNLLLFNFSDNFSRRCHYRFWPSADIFKEFFFFESQNTNHSSVKMTEALWWKSAIPNLTIMNSFSERIHNVYKITWVYWLRLLTYWTLNVRLNGINLNGWKMATQKLAWENSTLVK